ncbi:hypothetical protein J6590_033683 [Homalodisca vitripennis]|nr:hypothetical protein J6590_033683 [Homalodisca vitripennis]
MRDKTVDGHTSRGIWTRWRKQRCPLRLGYKSIICSAIPAFLLRSLTIRRVEETPQLE